MLLCSRTLPISLVDQGNDSIDPRTNLIYADNQKETCDRAILGLEEDLAAAYIPGAIHPDTFIPLSQHFVPCVLFVSKGRSRGQPATLRKIRRHLEDTGRWQR
jgi:hypothetical protein